MVQLFPRSVLFTTVFAQLLNGSVAWAQEARVTLQSTVSGNQEQPRVMYILPWQPPAGLQHEQSVEGSIAKELFVPIDRDEFVRAMKYQRMLEPQVSGETLEH
jgi:hypothetical protein